MTRTKLLLACLGCPLRPGIRRRRHVDVSRLPAAHLVKQRLRRRRSPRHGSTGCALDVRLSNCTASFVSPEGLILTNHHCAEACLDENSTSREKPRQGRFPRPHTRPGAPLQHSGRGRAHGDGERHRQGRARRSATWMPRPPTTPARRPLTQLEQACEQDSAKHESRRPLKCESVTLYQGGQYWLYKYHRYDDVRLVFAPEEAIAAFGGDPDNFQFPRWCLDMSVLRAYDSHGKPAASRRLPARSRPEGPKAGELVFVSGHPGSTDRLLTVAQLQELRDMSCRAGCCALPSCAAAISSSARPAPKRTASSEDPLHGLENSSRCGASSWMPCSMIACCNTSGTRSPRCAPSWPPTRSWPPRPPIPGRRSPRPRDRARAGVALYLSWSRAPGFNSTLFGYARTLVRGAAESARSPTPTGCANIATRRCRASSSGSGAPCRSTRSSRSSRCPSRSSACASGWGRTRRSCASCWPRIRRTRWPRGRLRLEARRPAGAQAAVGRRRRRRSTPRTIR